MVQQETDMTATFTICVETPPMPPEWYEELRLVVRKWQSVDEKFEPDELPQALDYWVRQGLEDCDLFATCNRYGPDGWTHTLRCDITMNDENVYQWGYWHESL